MGGINIVFCYTTMSEATMKTGTSTIYFLSGHLIADKRGIIVLIALEKSSVEQK